MTRGIASLFLFLGFEIQKMNSYLRDLARRNYGDGGWRAWRWLFARGRHVGRGACVVGEIEEGWVAGLEVVVRKGEARRGTLDGELAWWARSRRGGSCSIVKGDGSVDLACVAEIFGVGEIRR
ncbi:hypothetical protein L484_021554 [Morus notabilis]|uniref:Uncharacterized protein n=1 Tax=Morus notabilis TaxID=981085 RepID=W9RSI5_9ROSA|nr:hypothetical protein L484_021554 [Morus notabilis]